MKFTKKVGFLLAATFCVVMASASAQAQVFSQNFNSSAVVADYVSATPNTGQFNAITVAGAATVSINTGTLEFVRPGSDAGTFSRTTDLLSPAPTALIYKMDVSAPTSSGAATSAAFFQVGSGFGTTNAAETATVTYAQFSINFTATSGTFQIRNLTTGTNSGDFTGTQTITWALNNSGSTLSYLAPDASTETVANDTVDIWIGTTKAFNDVAVTTATQSMSDLKFAFTSGNGTIRVDNMEITAPLIDGLFYRSVASGNWNSNSTWESSIDNVTFSPATHPPNSDSNSITIKSPHTVTITADVPYDQLTVDSGAQVTVASTVTHTLINGTGTDLTINGTWLNSGGTWTITGATWTVGAGGTYIHNTTSSAATPLGVVTLDPASTWIYRGSSAPLVPAISTSGRSYGNLIFDSSAGSWSNAGSPASGSGTLTVNGDFTIGSGVTFTTTQTGVMTFAGNFTNNGTLTNSTNTQVYTFTGSGKTIGGASAIAFETWNVNPGASITLGSNVSIASTFTGTISGTLNCGTNLVAGAGAFTLASGGTLAIGSVDGITSSGATGNIQSSGTRTFNTGANYTYNGISGAQVTGNGLPATVNNLTISNGSGVGLTSSVAVSNTLTLSSGTFSIGANTLTLNNPIAGTPTNLAGGATSSITIAGTASGINLPSSISALNNLTLNNSTGTTLPGALTLSGTLTLSNGALSIGANTLTLNGEITTTSGSLTGGASSNIAFGGAGASTALPAVTLNNLTIGRANGISLGGNVTVGGTLALTSGDLTTTDSFILTENGTSSGTGDVIGTVERSDVGAGPVAFGNPNVQITNGSGMTLQVLLVKSAPDSFSSAVTRIYSLNIVSGSVSSATLRLHYLDAELNSNDPSLLHLWRADGSPSATWTDQGVSSSQTGSEPNNWVELTGVSGFSSWTLASAPSAPTAVKLTKFKAASFADGVALTWESGFEVNNLGYHIYREQNGVRTRVTPSPVAGSALKLGPGARMTAGNAYSWFDPQGTADSTYSLEAIDLNGGREVVGPLYPVRGAGESPLAARRRALLLNEVAKAAGSQSSGKRTAASLSANLTERPAAMTEKAKSTSSADKVKEPNLQAQQAIAAGQAVKIAVPRNGWYRVTQPELLAAGLDVNSDARRLQLFVEGVEVPIRVSGDQTHLGANDSLEFYGLALDTLTTDTQVYWLVNGSTAGKRLNEGLRTRVKPADNNWEDPGGGFAMTTERKDKLVYFSGLLNGDGENIFGPPVTTDPLSQVLTVKNLDHTGSAAAQVSVTLQGLTAGEHNVEVQLNGNRLGTISFTGLGHPAQTFTTDRSLLREGDNTITLTATNGDEDVSLVDTVGLTYGHAYRADNNALRFSATAGQLVMVSGFTTPDIRVIDITNPARPNELPLAVGPQGSGYAFKLQASGAGTRTFVAFTNELAETAAQVTANQPSRLTATQSADLLIVTHRALRAAVEPLAAQRRSEGLQVAVVDIEDVYDEFSYGAHTPEALRDFLGWAATHWQRAPHYLLLAGDSSWDPRNYLEQGNGDLVPTKLIDTAYMETASDDWLADFNGDGAADMAVGRLPGRTAAEVERMVAKLLLYEQERQLGAPLRGALMVADTGFESQSQTTAGLLPSTIAVQSLNRSEAGSDDVLRGQIVNGIDAGPLLVNYYGHGSVTVWTGAGLLDTELAGTLTNQNQPTLFVMMTCLNGYAHDAYIDSLAESLLKAENGGAMAVWASSGFTEPEPQFAMNQQFYQQVFRLGMRLGDAVRTAKGATGNSDVRRTWMLLGDPSMRMR